MIGDELRLIRYLAAEQRQDEEYHRDGTFHPDICNCRDCQDILAWRDMSWWRRLLAKLDL